MAETEQNMIYDTHLDDDDIGKLCFYDERHWNSALSHIVSQLEQNFEVIRQELNNICEHDFMKWVETICKDGWTVFGLYGFGRKLPENTEKCPKTTRLIEQIFSEVNLEITTAGFSSLHPGTYICPHRGYEGYSDNILRVHLALVVPEDKCALRVGNEKRRWYEGKCMVFDDFISHEAWNFGEKTRINLLLDVKYMEKDYMVRSRSSNGSAVDGEKGECDDEKQKKKKNEAKEEQEDRSSPLSLSEQNGGGESQASKGIDCKNANFSVGLKGVLDQIDKTGRH